MQKIFLVSVPIFILTIAITGLWCDFFQEHVYLSACDPKEQVIAKIIWRMSSPTLLDSYLAVDDYKGKRILIRPLQSGRDHRMDVYMNYQAIEVSNRTVSIRTSSDKGLLTFHYTPFPR